MIEAETPSNDNVEPLGFDREDAATAAGLFLIALGALSVAGIIIAMAIGG